MKKNVYVIENRKDRTNAMGEELFATFADAKRWADCVEEDIENYNTYADEDEFLSKEDFIVSYYDENGVQRGEWNLFGGFDMKELKNNFDKEISFKSLEEAKKYLKPNSDFSELEGYAEYTAEFEEAASLEELADVLNKYTDTFGNGSEWYVHEF